jgi:hypothetical protein
MNMMLIVKKVSVPVELVEDAIHWITKLYDEHPYPEGIRKHPDQLSPYTVATELRALLRKKVVNAGELT